MRKIQIFIEIISIDGTKFFVDSKEIDVFLNKKFYGHYKITGKCRIK